jgi:hypothetical protein
VILTQKNDTSQFVEYTGPIKIKKQPPLYTIIPRNTSKSCISTNKELVISVSYFFEEDDFR